MNPWAFIVIAVGILIMIVGVKGTQHNIASAVVGHKTGGSTGTPGNNAPPSNSGPVLA